MNDDNKGNIQEIERNPSLDKILYPEEIATAYKEDEILINFYGIEKDFINKKSEKLEYNTAYPAEQFLSLILNLIQVGVEYEQEYRKNIGINQIRTILSKGDGNNE